MREAIPVADLPKRVDQVEQRDFERRLLAGFRNLRLRAGPESGAQRIDLVERFRRLLVALVFEEAAGEIRPRVLLGLAGSARQQHPGLDVDELRGERDVVRRDVEVELPHRVEVQRVLLGDLGDRDVRDRDLVDPDQVEEEIERTGERGDRDRWEGLAEAVFGHERTLEMRPNTRFMIGFMIRPRMPV